VLEQIGKSVPRLPKFAPWNKVETVCGPDVTPVASWSRRSRRPRTWASAEASAVRAGVPATGSAWSLAAKNTVLRKEQVRW
jgi:hypothetical protein